MPVLISDEQRKVTLTPEQLEIVNSVVEKGLEQEGYDPEKIEVSIAFVDNDRIRLLNSDFRQVDASTDVLSFPMDSPTRDADEEEVLLGDIVVSLEMARAQGETFGHGFVRELAYLIAHGLFHLLGYDHETEEEKAEMREAEERLLSRVLPDGRASYYEGEEHH